MKHDIGCACKACHDWFKSMGQFTGRCGRCGVPIDDHPKDEVGGVTMCPRAKAGGT